MLIGKRCNDDYGDVHRVGEKEFRVVFQQVSGNIEENHNILQIE